MLINTCIKYMEGYFPTKRCRKLRFRECKELLDLELKEVCFADIKKRYKAEGRLYIEYNNLF